MISRLTDLREEVEKQRECQLQQTLQRFERLQQEAAGLATNHFAEDLQLLEAQLDEASECSRKKITCLPANAARLPSKHSKPYKLELNPAPFCMLDEVDAPLDEANVGRFCELVRQMAEQVQFIFITHNKTTMELAENLIGVTMRESGVSRLVAVDVAEAVKLANG